MSSTAAKTITAEDFFRFVQQSENRGRRFELCAGEVIEMPPTGKFHGFVCGNVVRVLGNFAASRRRGYVCSNDSGVIVGRDPDTVRGPDVTFYEDQETAETMSRKYAETPPVLAVEVLSPSDSTTAMMHRVMQLLHRGVRTVWVVDPEARQVSVCQTGQQPQLAGPGGWVDGGAALPEFRCRADELFARPGPLAEQADSA